MGRVAIIGSGLAGLSAALFLARRGHQVTILEKDADDLSAQAEGAWIRQGVGHASQTHAFLARSTKVMAEEAPDVLSALDERGAYRRINEALANADPASPQPIYERRLGYEAVLRAKVLAEPKAELRLGQRVAALIADAENEVPHVRGVRTEAGEEVLADLTVDAGGRRSFAPRWLAEIGARAPVETSQACGFSYVTRWFRLREGVAHPEGVLPAAGRTHFGTYILCPAGGRLFSVALTFSEHEPFRHAFRDPRLFDRLAATIPALAPWIEGAEGVGEPQPFGGIENRRRKLVDEEGPVVAGMVLLGDAAMHTNPSLGRGVSLAFSHAQYLAHSIDEAFAEPLDYVAAFEAWTDENLGEWFDTQVQLDAELSARFHALAKDLPLPELSERGRFGAAMQILAQQDAVVAAAFSRVQHLLTKPSELATNLEVGRRVAAYLRETAQLPDMTQGVTRAEFAGWVSG